MEEIRVMILNFSDKAEKDLNKVEKSEAKKIKEKIDQYIKSPLSVKVKKLKGYQELYRIRQGNYRILFKIIANEIKIMYIMRIQHRKEVYKDL